MPLYMIEGDITQVHADAIVNAANTGLRPGGGVCGAIFKAAGHEQLRRACIEIGHCDEGEAVITPGFELSKYIIHTPGPVWLDGAHGEEATLRRCYLSSLKLAVEYDCQSIAFPLISSGIFGYPFDEALRTARETILTFLQDCDITVFLVLFRSPYNDGFLEKVVHSK